MEWRRLRSVLLRPNHRQIVAYLMGAARNGRPFLVSHRLVVPHQFAHRFGGGNSQKIGRVENGGCQPLGGMTSEDFEPFRGRQRGAVASYRPPPFFRGRMQCLDTSRLSRASFK